LSLQPFIPWMHSRRPIDWHQMFGRTAQLELEIGFGLGDFLVQKAQAHPEKNFVGIELRWVLVRRALRKTALAGVKNVRIVRADVRAAVDRIFLEMSLQSAYALFPCPWPKKRHIIHRLFSNAFLKALNSRMVHDGKLLIVTDACSYFKWILSQLPGTGFEANYKMVSPKFSTKYERKWYKSGQERFYELSLIKREHMKIPLKEDISLITHRASCFDPEHFQPSNTRGDISVEFKETLYDPKQKKGMVRSVVSEENLLQDFWIEIVKKETLWHIRPAKGCGFIPTAGLQKALDLIYEATSRMNNCYPNRG